MKEELYNKLKEEFYRCNHPKYRKYFEEWVINVQNSDRMVDKPLEFVRGHRIKAITLALQANYQGSIPCGSTYCSLVQWLRIVLLQGKGHRFNSYRGNNT